MLLTSLPLGTDRHVHPLPQCARDTSVQGMLYPMLGMLHPITELWDTPHKEANQHQRTKPLMQSWMFSALALCVQCRHGVGTPGAEQGVQPAHLCRAIPWEVWITLQCHKTHTNATVTSTAPCSFPARTEPLTMLYSMLQRKAKRF